MTRYEYGDPDALSVLIQMVDDHDLSVIESEAAAIREKTGDCVMPREGIFARVLEDGEAKPGDWVTVL